MVNYRRLKIPGGIYFFTVTLQDREATLLIDEIKLLRISIKTTQSQLPYKIIAIVILPDHIHTMWELPDNDDDYASRWMKIKWHFTRGLIKKGMHLKKNTRGEYNLWQRRYWEHAIRDDKDYFNHVNYIHYNPVKHRLVKRVRDWKYSSFHRFVRAKILPIDWCDAENHEPIWNGIASGE